MITKVWVNSERNISLSIKYEDIDKVATTEGNLYNIKIWNLSVIGLSGAGFLDDYGNHIFLMRGDNRYDSSIKVYEEFVV
jgi:hypothetical protein